MDQHPLPRFALPGDWSEPWCTLALSAPTAIPANCSMVPGAIEKPTQQSALSRNPILDRTLKRVSVDACSWLELQRAPVGDDAVTRLVSDCRIGVAIQYVLYAVNCTLCTVRCELYAVNCTLSDARIFKSFHPPHPIVRWTPLCTAVALQHSYTVPHTASSSLSQQRHVC
jgi:hypothetical protein